MACFLSLAVAYTIHEFPDNFSIRDSPIENPMNQEMGYTYNLLASIASNCNNCISVEWIMGVHYQWNRKLTVSHWITH